MMINQAGLAVALFLVIQNAVPAVFRGHARPPAGTIARAGLIAVVAAARVASLSIADFTNFRTVHGLIAAKLNRLASAPEAIRTASFCPVVAVLHYAIFRRIAVALFLCLINRLIAAIRDIFKNTF